MSHGAIHLLITILIVWS